MSYTIFYWYKVIFATKHKISGAVKKNLHFSSFMKSPDFKFQIEFVNSKKNQTIWKILIEDIEYSNFEP